MHILLYLMSLKLVEHKVIDHEPLPLPPSCLGGVHHQVATDLRILVTCLHLWGRGGRGGEGEGGERGGEGEGGERGGEGGEEGGWERKENGDGRWRRNEEEAEKGEKRKGGEGKREKGENGRQETKLCMFACYGGCHVL